MKNRTKRKRWVLKSDEFAPLNEVIAETDVGETSVSASLYLPGYDKIHRLDLWVAGDFYEHRRDPAAEVQVVSKNLDLAIRDLDNLCEAITHLREFLIDQETPLIERVRAKSERLKKQDEKNAKKSVPFLPDTDS